MNVFDYARPKAVVRQSRIKNAKPSVPYSDILCHGENWSVRGIGECWQDELMHYGIKGQKWGVRRYQNEDGSLTDAGKARVAKTAGSGYLNPNREDVKKGKADERHKVSDAYQKEWNKHFSADNHPTTMDSKEREIWDSFKDKYAKATLKDLKLKNTKAARLQVKALLKEIDPSYDYGAEYTISQVDKMEKRRKELSHPIREKAKRGLKKVQTVADVVASVKKAVL